MRMPLPVQLFRIARFQMHVHSSYQLYKTCVVWGLFDEAMFLALSISFTVTCEIR